MTVIERLEKLAELTPDTEFERTYGRPATDSWVDRRDRNYLGLGLRQRQGNAARNALPDLLKLARAASRLRVEEVADVGTVIVAWPDVKAALEPLFREVSS